MLGNLKLGPRLILGFMLVALGTVLVGVVGVRGIRRIDALDTTLYERMTAPLGALHRVGIEFELARIALRDLALGADAARRSEAVAAVRRHVSEAEAHLREYEKTILSEEMRQVTASFRSDAQEYFRFAEKLATSAERGDAESVRAGLQDEHFHAVAADAQKALDAMVAMKIAHARQASDDNTAVADSTVATQDLIIAAVVLIALVLGVLVTRSIARPIAQMDAAARALAAGDVDHEITYRSGDEVGALAESLRRTTETLRGMSAEVGRLIAAASDGRLSERGDASKYGGAFGALIGGINQVLDGMVTPLRISAGYFERISKGEIPAKITDDFKGEFNVIKQNLNLCIDTLNRLLAEMKAMHAAQVVGDIDVFADEARFDGAYRQMIAGVNEGVRLHIRNILRILEILGAYADGNLEPTLERLPGKQVVANDRLEQLRGNLRGLVEEVGQLTKAAAEGRLSARADARRFGGEYRRIVDGVNATLDNFGVPVREVSTTLERIATGDLTARIDAEFPGDYGALKRSVNTVVDQVRGAMQRIAESTTTLAAASEELNASSAQMATTAEETSSQANVVSAASEQVSKNVQIVSTSTQEMSASVKEIARSASDAARVAGAAMQLANGTNATISKLGQSSAEIGQVIKVITSIAQQTNLLALNATIEAARAGEAGKGFAVVANEVKELAKETARATEDISRRIETIQADTGSAVEAIEQIGAVIRQINEIQATIATAVEEQSATTSSIESNVAEAAKATGEIARSITGVAEAAGSTASGATGTQTAAAGLSRMASDLQTLVGQFQL